MEYKLDALYNEFYKEALGELTLEVTNGRAWAMVQLILLFL